MGARGRAKQNKWFWYFISETRTIGNEYFKFGMCCQFLLCWSQPLYGIWYRLVELVRWAVMRTEWYLLSTFNVKCQYSHRKQSIIAISKGIACCPLCTICVFGFNIQIQAYVNEWILYRNWIDHKSALHINMLMESSLVNVIY